MNWPTVFFVSLVCAGMSFAADNKTPLIACNMAAVSSSQRPRYNALMKRLRGSIQGRREIADGYTFELDPKGITMAELGEWITLERLCCSFLTFGLELKNDGATQLSMRGPEGTKTILAEDFPEKAK
jgi:hypothetical protein